MPGHSSTVAYGVNITDPMLEPWTPDGSRHAPQTEPVKQTKYVEPPFATYETKMRELAMTVAVWYAMTPERTGRDEPEDSEPCSLGEAVESMMWARDNGFRFIDPEAIALFWLFRVKDRRKVTVEYG